MQGGKNNGEDCSKVIYIQLAVFGNCRQPYYLTLQAVKESNMKPLLNIMDRGELN